MTRENEIPPGIEHIAKISQNNTINRRLSENLLRQQKQDLRVLGTSLSALYVAATCSRKCMGGDHIIEKIASRIYNLASASYSLISIGLYDEALCLVRSIGEIANLLSLPLIDKEKFLDWIKSSKQERIKQFGPMRVRLLLEKHGVTLMDQEWYNELSESYTHIVPHVKVNNFNNDGKNICGAFVQNDGVETSVGQLTTIVASIALFYCRYFELDDYFELLIEEIKQ